MTLLRDVVVIVPGIGGSILADGNRPVWGDHLGRAVARVLDPDRLALDGSDRIQPIGLIQTSWILPGVAVMHGYGNLVDQIGARFTNVVLDTGHPDDPHDDANVVLFPYDFRQSVVHAAERLARRVDKALLVRGRDVRVVVVAHSLGGLVARYWLGHGGGKDCRALITLGTPHSGAPKALDTLVNGIRLGPVRIHRPAATLRGWPSMYELLPTYRCVLNPDGEPCRPHELAIQGLDTALATAAATTHGAIEAGWATGSATEGVEVASVFGRGHATPSRGTFDGNVLTVTAADAEWLDQERWAGDGTVPHYAAIAAEQRSLTRHLTGLRHGRLASWSGIVPMLEVLQGAAAPPVRAVDSVDERPVLGLDLAEWYPAGEPTPVGVALLGEQEVGRIRVTVRDEHGPPAPLPATKDGVGWVVVIPSLPPGLYTLEARAEDVAGLEPLPVREDFLVVDPEAAS